MERKRRGTRVETFRVRERGGVQKVCHTTMATAQYPSSGVPLIKISSSASMVTSAKVSRWLPRDGLDSEFPSPRTPARDRQFLAISSRYARQFDPWLLIWLFAANLYIPIHIRKHIYIYMHTHIHIHKCVNTHTHLSALRLCATFRRATP